MAVVRPFLSTRCQILIGGIVLAGIASSLAAYRFGSRQEEDQIVADLTRRSALRHALTAEVLENYEDALFGLSTLFVQDGTVSRSEFVRAAVRLQERIGNSGTFEWVPLVRAGERAAAEEAGRRAYDPQPFEFIEFDDAGRRRRAAERPFYYPVSQIQPLAGNEIALGYDLATGIDRESLERARATRRLVVTGQVGLVQERGGQPGIIMILPVHRPSASQAATGDEPDAFLGFVLSVFRARELLASVQAHQSDPVCDVLFVDRSESDPTRRSLYYRPAVGDVGGAVPSEAEFRQGSIILDQALPFGGRDWQVLYRPREGWVAQQLSLLPYARSGAVLVLTGLLAGLFGVLGRRTATIRAELIERTAELAESRRLLAGLLHALPGMAFRCTDDDQLTVQFVSEGVRELTGWSPEELMAGRAHFRDLIHPEDLVRVREAMQRALRERSEMEIEYRLRTRVGVERWVLARGRGLYDTAGGLDFFEGLAIDITARKDAEAARLELERKLLEGQKLESLGLLAGGIAHDFNNLLSTILGNAGILRSTEVPGLAGNPQLAAIEMAALRAAELCRQMLAYAGRGNFVIEPTDLTTLTGDLVPLLDVSIAHQATLSLQLAPDLPTVMADATQLRQIVMNLVLNAADAIGDRGGTIAISTGVVAAERSFLAACVTGGALPPAHYVFLEVCDTGVGMPPEVVAKIFDPFYTTKFAGRGLGLAAVLGIVRAHHGALHVRSTVGRGTAFRLLLPPVTHALPPPKPAPAVPVARWKRTGMALVVDDEEPVRTMLLEILKYIGFTATGATGGAEAVELFQARAGGFDLVVLDMVMPGQTLEQTLVALRAVDPRVRVLLVSGDTPNDAIGRLGDGRPLAFLSKPFTREALERALQDLFA